MHGRLDTLQTYDWNELAGDKPLHNVALIDRLQSYYPGKPTWAILDDCKLFLGREARQRKAALALTRGLQGLGTNFLAQTTVEQWPAQSVTPSCRSASKYWCTAEKSDSQIEMGD